MPDKASLRAEILAKRDGISSEARGKKSVEIEKNLLSLEEYKNSETLLIFASFRTEVETSGIMVRALGDGKRVILPRVEGKKLCLYRIYDISELFSGYMGIPEPSVLTDDRRKSINDVDVVIVPGSVFDEEGNRVGYGGGYYDRLLAGLKHHVPIIAICFEEQVVRTVPTEPHDIRVGIVVTDKRIIRTT